MTTKEDVEALLKDAIESSAAEGDKKNGRRRD
jgi:hypothetical protein